MLRRSGDGGAVAVEFALLVPLLILLLTAILDYGLWFSDSIALRHGVREAARSGVVDQFPGCEGAGTAAEKTECVVNSRVDGILSGDPVTRVYSPPNGTDWQEGDPLIVCAVLQEDGLTGLAPLPDDGFLRSHVIMRVEVEQPSPDGDSVRPADPTGDNWAWCAP